MSPGRVRKIQNRVVIVACPVSKGEVRHVSGVGVLMALQFVERSEQLETGDHSALQFLLDPDQALEIAEALRRSIQALELGKTLKKALRKQNKPANKPAMLLSAPAPDLSGASSEPADSDDYSVCNDFALNEPVLSV